MTKIAVLITSYNRRSKTINCIERITSFKGFNIDIYLVDDGSIDDTKEIVAENFPSVKIISGNGNLFWSRGMHSLAWEYASKVDYDFYIWMNDDVIIYNDAFDELFECSASKNHNAIISGIIENAETKETLYGGSDKNGLIVPNGKMNTITNLNGNVVLVPRKVFKALGNLDPVFHHDLGDVDYGLRAQKADIGVFTTRIAVASGEKNNFCRVRKWNSNITDRFKKLYSPLGNHPAINFYFRNKHFGLMNALSYWLYIHLINILSDKIIVLLFADRYKNNLN